MRVSSCLRGRECLESLLPGRGELVEQPDPVSELVGSAAVISASRSPPTPFSKAARSMTSELVARRVVLRGRGVHLRLGGALVGLRLAPRLPLRC